MRSLVFLFALLFALCTHPFLGEAQGGPIMELVIDTDNNTLQAGKDYYIRPVPTSPSIICSRLPCLVGPGFALQSTTPNKTCPLNVVVVRGTGQAVTFTPVNPKTNREIYTNSDLNIKFDVKSNCSESTVWKLVNDVSSGQRIVTTGGVIGNPGKNTVNNWFQIQKDDNDYNLYFCPKVCETCKPVCGNIGVFQDSNGNSLVAITDKPYKVRFQPVSS